MMEVLSMGKYSAYVWSSFGLALLVFVFVEWRTRVRHRKVHNDVRMRIRASEESA